MGSPDNVPSVMLVARESARVLGREFKLAVATRYAAAEYARHLSLRSVVGSDSNPPPGWQPLRVFGRPLVDDAGVPWLVRWGDQSLGALPDVKLEGEEDEEVPGAPTQAQALAALAAVVEVLPTCAEHLETLERYVAAGRGPDLREARALAAQIRGEGPQGPYVDDLLDLILGRRGGQ